MLRESDEKLIRMANQIAINLAAQGEDVAVKETAAHIRAFWSRDMKTQLRAIHAAGGQGLGPVAAKAAALL